MAVFESLGHCHFIGIFQIAAYRYAQGYAAYFNSDRIQKLGDVYGCRLPFYVGICRQDDLLYIPLTQAFQKVLEHQVFRSDTINGRENAMKDMILAMIFPSSFDSQDITRLFHNADCIVGTMGVIAVLAGILIRIIIAS